MVPSSQLKCCCLWGIPCSAARCHLDTFCGLNWLITKRHESPDTLLASSLHLIWKMGQEGALFALLNYQCPVTANFQRTSVFSFGLVTVVELLLAFWMEFCSLFHFSSSSKPVFKSAGRADGDLGCTNIYKFVLGTSAENRTLYFIMVEAPGSC